MQHPQHCSLKRLLTCAISMTSTYFKDTSTLDQTCINFKYAAASTGNAIGNYALTVFSYVLEMC